MKEARAAGSENTTASDTGAAGSENTTASDNASDKK